MIDRQTMFSNAQAITASAASTDLVDTGAAQDWGIGKPQLYVVVICTVAMTDAASNSTVTVTVESDDAAAFPSATTVQTLPVFAALAAAGTVRVMALAPMTTNERYIRLYYTVANGDLSTGSFTAFLTTDPPALNEQYADNITIS